MSFSRTLVQTLLSSSHQGYGVGSLDKDADEIHLLAKFLKTVLHSEVPNTSDAPAEYAAQSCTYVFSLWDTLLLSDRQQKGASVLVQAIILMGHSTGCQDAVRYAAKYGNAADAPQILAYILQAPVRTDSPPCAYPTLTPIPLQSNDPIRCSGRLSLDLVIMLTCSSSSTSRRLRSMHTPQHFCLHV